jgi:hypothetical protein
MKMMANNLLACAAICARLQVHFAFIPGLEQQADRVDEFLEWTKDERESFCNSHKTYKYEAQASEIQNPFGRLCIIGLQINERVHRQS